MLLNAFISFMLHFVMIFFWTEMDVYEEIG